MTGPFEVILTTPTAKLAGHSLPGFISLDSRAPGILPSLPRNIPRQTRLLHQHCSDSTRALTGLNSEETEQPKPNISK